MFLEGSGGTDVVQDEINTAAEIRGCRGNGAFLVGKEDIDSWNQTERGVGPELSDRSFNIVYIIDHAKVLDDKADSDLGDEADKVRVHVDVVKAH